MQWAVCKKGTYPDTGALFYVRPGALHGQALHCVGNSLCFVVTANHP